MRRLFKGNVAVFAVLLCLQATATMMAVRRDPGDRFRAAAISGLVWVSLRRMTADGGNCRLRAPVG